MRAGWISGELAEGAHRPVRDEDETTYRSLDVGEMKIAWDCLDLERIIGKAEGI